MIKINEESYKLGLSDLLDQDISSYEYFYSLSEDIQRKIIEKDINSFEDMTSYVSKLKNKKFL